MFIPCELKDILFDERLKTKRYYEQHRNNYPIPHKIRPVQEQTDIILIFLIFKILILNTYPNSAKDQFIVLILFRAL